MSGTQTGVGEAGANSTAMDGIMSEVFGFDGFRPGQREAVSAVLSGRDVLAVMPTSGGKSLCYQIPALMLDGLTVVVCPLVSLMKDQIENLSEKLSQRSNPWRVSSPVAAYHSALSAGHRREIEERVVSGGIKLLYVAPERLRSLEFAVMLKRASRGAGVSLFVVDEAHCLSEWGHSFRPEYLFTKSVIDDLAKPGGARPPVMALTATADPRVQEDVVGLLGLRDPERIKTGFDRPNLSYKVRKTGENAGGDRLEVILEILENGEAPAIVYAHTRRECEEISAGLAQAGTPAEAYHAGMSPEDRDAVQTRFMRDEVSVIVATIAFGMGVDKPNIRQVIHAGIPASIPAYVQEAGRAGRDGNPAACTVLYSDEEVEKRKRLPKRGVTTAEQARKYFELLNKISTPDPAGPAGPAVSDGESPTRRVNLTQRELLNLGGEGQDAASDIIRALEAMGRIQRRYNVWAGLRVKSILPDAKIPGHRVEGLTSGKTGAVLRALRIDRNSGSGFTKLPELAASAGLSPATVQVALIRLIKSGVVNGTSSGSLVDLAIKPGPLSKAELHELDRRFGVQAEVAERHLDDVENYTSLKTCRRARLLSYFGDDAAAIVSPCKGCDICNRRNHRRGSRKGGQDDTNILGRIWSSLFNKENTAA